MLQSSFHQGSALRQFRNSRVSREDVEALADDAADLLGKLVSFGGGEIGGDTSACALALRIAAACLHRGGEGDPRSPVPRLAEVGLGCPPALR
jgi:hypothetical protein